MQPLFTHSTWNWPQNWPFFGCSCIVITLWLWLFSSYCSACYCCQDAAWLPYENRSKNNPLVRLGKTNKAMTPPARSSARLTLPLAAPNDPYAYAYPYPYRVCCCLISHTFATRWFAPPYPHSGHIILKQPRVASFLPLSISISVSRGCFCGCGCASVYLLLMPL